MDDSFDRRLTRIEDLLIRTREDIATLKVKSSVWGFFAGLLPVLTALAYTLLK